MILGGAAAALAATPNGETDFVQEEKDAHGDGDGGSDDEALRGGEAMGRVWDLDVLTNDGGFSRV